MKKKVLFFSLTCMSLFFVLKSSVFAQTPITQTQFPFTINGVVCSTKAECKVLCNDPVNKAACKALRPVQTKTDKFSDPAFAEAAKTVLGCSTAQSCKVVCSLPANYQKCTDFAKTEKIPGGYNLDLQSPELLKLTSELVSDDQTIKDYCDQEQNQKVCTLLAQKFGLRGGILLEGPGGCQTAESCRAYCDDPAHFSECKEFEIPGANECSSELACYNEVQSDPELLELLSQRVYDDSSDRSLEVANLSEQEEIAKACQSVILSVQGSTASQISSALEKSGFCQVLPQTGVIGGNNNCDAYLESDQPFSVDTFNTVCTISPVITTKETPKIQNPNNSEEFVAYGDWCKQLPSVGQAANEWQAVPELCQSFVNRFTEARKACDLPEGQRPEWLKDDVSVSKYCLSAPVSMSDYALSCKANQSSCQEHGYDWYCDQPGNDCQPLYQGTPLRSVVGSFSEAGVIKDEQKVSLVLNDQLTDFAKEVVAPNIEVVDRVPDNLSSTAVFAAGVGKLKKPEPVQDQSRETFVQPWYSIQQPQTSQRPQVSTSPGNSKESGWGMVKSSEELRVKSVTPQPIRALETIQPKKEDGRVRPNPSIKVSPLPERTRTPRPQVSQRAGSVQPTTFIQSSGSSSQFTQPLKATETPKMESSTSDDSSGTSGNDSTDETESSSQPSPIPATNTTTNTSAGGTTTNSGTSSTGNTGTTYVVPSPKVEGASTELDLGRMLRQQLLELLF